MGKTERRPRRTLRWLGSSRGGPELWRRRRAAAGGARQRRRGGSSGDWARRRGGLASRRRGKANGGVGAGGEGLERRFRSGVELTGVRARRRRCSGVWGWGISARVSESVEERLLVLMRAREKSGGLCPGLSTAASMWRPRAVFWARGKARRGHGAGQKRRGSSGATRGS